MNKYFQDKYVLSYEGSRQFIVAIIWTVIMDLSFFIPVILGFKFLQDAIAIIQGRIEATAIDLGLYIIMAILSFGAMFAIAYRQYHSTFSTTYEESAKMRIHLAETLRKLPLAFFGKKDIADLSSTIMEDATQVEMMFSHSVPQIYAAAISIIVAGISLMAYQWKMVVAMLWVIPAAMIVFQDVTLFNASIMENIRLGRKDATDEEVMEAASLARCDSFIQKFPKGYDTLVGENGDKLSGGERQRISIARAILKNAPIILMDEATASLDAENETKIQEALGELIREKTVIVIAHRMRTVIGADKIVVLKEGEVVETGNLMILKERESMFAGMLRAQLHQG